MGRVTRERRWDSLSDGAQVSDFDEGVYHPCLHSCAMLQ